MAGRTRAIIKIYLQEGDHGNHDSHRGILGNRSTSLYLLKESGVMPLQSLATNKWLITITSDLEKLKAKGSKRLAVAYFRH